MQQRHENRKTYFQELATTSELHFLPYIHRFTSVTPQSRILEIGCGEGGNLVPFARIGCRVTGIDLSENRIRQARQFFQEERLPATFIASDIFQIIQLEEAFDIILIHDVIEHISEKYRLLEHIKRFLTPGGLLFISFPPWQMPFGGHQQICRNKYVSRLPFIHLLPAGIYSSLLHHFGESQARIDELLDIRKCRTSIELFEKLLCTSHYRFDTASAQFFLYLMLLSDTIMRNRIHELDYLKCLFIILMIIFHLSHIGSKYPYAKSIVYTFHMPAFLLISGYLINVHKKPEIFLKAMAWIFIPYTIMEISYACMSMLFPVWDGIKEISASVLLGKVLLDPIGPYWYLHTFILCGTTYYFVHTYLSSTPFIRLLVTSSLLLLFSYIFHLLTFANAFYFMAGTAIHLGKRPFLSCFPASFLAIIPLVFLCSQPENLNRGTLGGILITGLVISLSLYIYKHLPHTVKQASLFIGKNTLPILLFSPVFTALSKLFLPFFSFDPTGICFLCTATVITLYGSIFIAFCLDKACLSPFFFGKKILI